MPTDMLRFLLARLLHAVPVVAGVLLLSFALLYLSPADPALVLAGPDANEEIVAQIRQDMHLDQPLPVQFADYMSRLLHGDMGRSLLSNRPVAEELGAALGPTLELMAAALLWAVPLGLLLGAVAAVARGTPLDRAVMLVSVAGLSLPTFAAGMVLIQVFAFTLGWFPIQGRGGPPWSLNGLHHLALPALSLGLLMLGPVARLMRTSMLETVGADFIRTARAKGMIERHVIARHAVPNSLTSVVTVIGLLIGALLGSAVVIETVFSWPGLGRLAAAAISAGDLPLAQGCILTLALAFVGINIVVDLVCSLIDPRLRLK